MNEINEQVKAGVPLLPEVIADGNDCGGSDQQSINLILFATQAAKALETKSCDGVNIIVYDHDPEILNDVQGVTYVLNGKNALTFKCQAITHALISKGIEAYRVNFDITAYMASDASLVEALKASKVDDAPPPQYYGTEVVPSFQTKSAPVANALKEALMPKHKGEWGDIQPIQWLVPNMLHQKGVTMVYGDEQAGKSTLMTDLAMHLAGGETWLGRELKETSVLFITCEGGPDIMEKVWAFERKKFKVKNENIHKIDYQVSFAHDDLHVDTIIENIKELGINFGLIIIDTLSQVAMGLDFNSSKMGEVLARAQKLMSAFNCNVVLIAHVGKDSTRGIAGWKGFHNNTDSRLFIEVGDGDSRIVTIEKVKGRKKGEVKAFMFESEDWVTESGDLIEAPVVTYLDAPEATMHKKWKVLQQIKLSPNKTQKELVALLSGKIKLTANANGSSPELSNFMTWFVLNEMVQQYGNTKTYHITAVGEKQLAKETGLIPKLNNIPQLSPEENAELDKDL